MSERVFLSTYNVLGAARGGIWLAVAGGSRTSSIVTIKGSFGVVLVVMVGLRMSSIIKGFFGVLVMVGSRTSSIVTASLSYNKLILSLFSSLNKLILSSSSLSCCALSSIGMRSSSISC